MTERSDLTPELVLQAYAAGIFPMAEARDDPEIFWVDPHRRGVLPLDGFHLSRSLRRRIRRMSYVATADRDFAGVVSGCADRDETWINDTIFDIYAALNARGHAHSVELWEGQHLIGGVYGVAIGAAFFGESMFSRRTDASKIALAFLVHRLRAGGFQLFDTQFITPHLETLGAIEIPRETYRAQLASALTGRADFQTLGPGLPTADQVLQRSTQTS
ncbi:leucyl/phenylalanyl-tRNA--protein transferase [Tranquillimonas rosea]|uniref:Leucyl/phenylalanyl-tRNA--protein transferase n=1 Tax=Tranquillimonas rosea TaxID=641238 RepID=A0A1H9QAQ1_9RHOB|nr:leucyl/phenylalanyl-tRNA--protein transferase [Tranquillimonas rosea]SER57492.1 leucyl/phenylalanyl-tRNA--protein transferase [Tranquillimonas rosea]